MPFWGSVRISNITTYQAESIRSRSLSVLPTCRASIRNLQFLNNPYSLQQFLGLTELSLSNEIEDLVGSFPQPVQLVSLSDKFTTPCESDRL